jgi:translocation and assembly module TamB
MRAHELATHVRGDSLGLALDLEVAGGLQDSTWQGQIRRLAIDSKVTGAWDLARPVAVKANPSAGSIAGFCLVSTLDSLAAASGATAPPSLCLDGNWAKSGSSKAHVELTALPLARLGRVLPAGWSLKGIAELKADATLAADTRINGTANLTLAGGALTIAMPDTTDTIAFECKLAATAGAGGVKADLQSQLERAGAAFGDLKGEVALPRLTRLSSLSDSAVAQPLKANLHLAITDLTPLALMSPEIQRLEGAFEVSVIAGGTLQKPEVAAKATLKDGAADLPKAGLQLRQIQLTASGDQTKKLDLESSLVSNGGKLAITAQSLPAPPDSLRMAVQIKGERFAAMNTPEIQVCISPDLTAQVAGRNVDVKGEVKIPYTRIELKQIPPSAQGVSDDVQFVDADAEAKEPPVLVHADVRVALGDSVSFQGFGFASKFAGGLRVIEVPGQPTSATGELLVEEGHYQAYGQDLTIGTWGDSLQARGEPGRIIFTGGRADNPGLDIRAFREAEDGTVAGLHILGTAKKPEITLFSDPAMSEGDMLSYVLTGHEADEGGGSSDMLAKAALGMGLKGGNVMGRNLGSKVGLDTSIETSGGLDEASFVTGKYLSPKLYVSHGYGLFDGVSTFRARYLLRKELTVQAETGEGTGGDVFYRLERGK